MHSKSQKLPFSSMEVGSGGWWSALDTEIKTWGTRVCRKLSQRSEHTLMMMR